MSTAKRISQREARRLKRRVEILESALKAYKMLAGDVIQERVRQFNDLDPETVRSAAKEKL